MKTNYHFPFLFCLRGQNIKCAQLIISSTRLELRFMQIFFRRALKFNIRCIINVGVHSWRTFEKMFKVLRISPKFNALKSIKVRHYRRGKSSVNGKEPTMKSRCISLPYIDEILMIICAKNGYAQLSIMFIYPKQCVMLRLCLTFVEHVKSLRYCLFFSCWKIVKGL